MKIIINAFMEINELHCIEILIKLTIENNDKFGLKMT